MLKLVTFISSHDVEYKSLQPSVVLKNSGTSASISIGISAMRYGV